MISLLLLPLLLLLLLRLWRRRRRLRQLRLLCAPVRKRSKTFFSSMITAAEASCRRKTREP